MPVRTIIACLALCATATHAQPVVTSTLQPSSHYVHVGETATFLETVTNQTGAPVLSCAPTPPANFEVGESQGVPYVGDFSYQAYDQTNGNFLAPAGQTMPLQPRESVSFLIAMTPLVAEFAGDQQIPITCAGGVSTAAQVDVNTMYFGAYPWASPDVIMASSAGFGTVTLPADGSYTAFAVATENVGVGDSLIFYADLDGSGNLPLQFGLCQTDATGACVLGFWGVSDYLDVPSGAVQTFTVFVRATAPIPPGTAFRIFVRAEDTTGYTYGAVGTNMVVR